MMEVHYYTNASHILLCEKGYSATQRYIHPEMEHNLSLVTAASFAWGWARH